MKERKILLFILIALAAVAAPSLIPAKPAEADVISPSINDDEATSYSREPANAAFFGKGVSGRMSEASYMRFGGEQALLEGDFKEAYRKLSKAVQFDPGDPTGHVMLARAMTGILRKAKNTEIDRDFLMRTMREWKQIQRHDADQTEQFEARDNLRKLARVVKLIKEHDLAVSLAKANEAKAKLADKVPTGESKDKPVVAEESLVETKGKALVAEKALKLDGSEVTR